MECVHIRNKNGRMVDIKVNSHECFKELDYSEYEELERIYKNNCYDALKEKDKKAFWLYTSEKDGDEKKGYHKIINDTLRGCNGDIKNLKDTSPKQKNLNEIIRTLYNAIHMATCPKNIYVFRNASLRDFNSIITRVSGATISINDLLRKNSNRILHCIMSKICTRKQKADFVDLIGEKIIYNTFVSTSLEKDVIDNNAYGTKDRYRLIIKVPKGTKAFCMPYKESEGFTKHGSEREMLLQVGTVLLIEKVRKVKDTKTFEYEIVTRVLDS